MVSLIRVVAALRSLKISIALMATLIPLIVAGNLIPQIGRAAPWEIRQWQAGNPALAAVVTTVGLDHVYTSSWFLTLFVLLCLNMALGTVDLFRRISLKAKGLHRFSGDISSFYSLGEIRHSEETLTAVEKVLRKKRYRVVAAHGEVYARKGWLGIWGGTVLHFGFVVILLGAAISGLTRFNGYTEMGVGQNYPDSAETYLQTSQGPLFAGHRPNVGIRVDAIDEKDAGSMSVLTSTVTIIDNGAVAVSKTLKMNDPLSYKGMTVYQARYSGPALLFAIADASNEKPVVGYVNLQDRATESSVFTFHGTPFQARASYSRGDDHIELEVHDGASLIYQGAVKPGQSLASDPWKITLVAINRWSGMIIVYDWAVPIIFFGFFLAVLGIAIMGLFDPREIWIRKPEHGRKAEILGWGRWRNMFLDEFREISQTVRNEART